MAIEQDLENLFEDAVFTALAPEQPYLALAAVYQLLEDEVRLLADVLRAI